MKRGMALLLTAAALAAAAVLYVRRNSAFTAGRAAGPPPLEAGELPPLEITAPPLVLRTDWNLPPAPASLMDRLSMVIGDAVDMVKQALLPRGIRNNNPGNLRTLPASKAWRGQVGDDGGGYAVYDTMQHGVRAAAKQLLVYERRGLRTVRQIITTWAPPIENLTGAYVNAVARALNVGADEVISVDDRLVGLAAAIFHHENGAPFTSFAAPGLGRNYTAAELAQWVRLP